MTTSGPVPALAPAKPASRYASAEALGGSRVDARTAMSDDYVNPDGSHTLAVSAIPVNYQVSPGGPWAPIDNAVEADPAVAGGLMSTASSWRVHFGSTVEGVSFDDGAGAVVGFRPLGATMVEPVVGSVPDQVVYANVWPNVDLVYTVTGAGVRENIVLKAPGAPGSFRFALRSASGALALGAVRGSLVSSVLGDGALPADVGVGVSATVLARRADGSMVPAGPGAKTVVFDPPLVLTGTRGTPAVEAHPSLAQAVPGTVSVGVDPGWLAAQPASAYPIDLDPSIGGNLPSSIYNYKADGYSCACGIGTMVGNSTSPTSTDYWRSVVAYPDLTTLNGTVILAAQLQSEYGGQGTRDQYVAYAHWASAFSYAGAANGGALASGIYGGGVWGDSGLTAQVQGWANTGSYGAFGFMGTETPGLYTYQTLNIWLYVAYAHHVGVANPVYPSPPNGALDHNLTITLAASANDPDGNTPEYYFRVALGSDAETDQVADSGWSTASSYTFSVPDSFWNTVLYWHVYSSDPYSGQTNPNYVWSFTVWDTPPPAPAGSLDAAGQVVAGGAPPTAPVVAATTTPTLGVPPVSDPQGDQVLYSFTITAGGDTPAGRASSGWQASPTWTVPAGVLRDGHVYSWSVEVGDGPVPGPGVENPGPWMTSGPTWSSWLRVNLRLGAQTVTPNDALGGVTVDLANGNATFSVTAHSMASVGGPLGVAFTYNSQAALSNGLLGQYFTGARRDWTFGTGNPPNFTPDTPVLVRVDPTFDMIWNEGGGDPTAPPGLTSQQFMARWTGYVTLPAGVAAGMYQLGAITDDGFRMWLGPSVATAEVTASGSGSSITTTSNADIDEWVDRAAPSAPNWDPDTVYLASGVVVPIRVDYYNQGGGAQMSLYIQGAPASGGDPAGSLATEIMPSSGLLPSLSSLPAGWSLSLPGGTASYTHASVANGVAVLTDGTGASHTWIATSPSPSVPVPAGSTSAPTVFTPPAGEDGALIENSDGSLTLKGSDGSIYTFDALGDPTSATSPADSLHPASAVYTYNTSTPPQVTTVTDPVSGRSIHLYYGGDPNCPSPPPGFDQTVPTDFLCRVSYWDGTTTDVLYAGGQLSRIVEPGGEDTSFGYTGGLVTQIMAPLDADWVAADPTDRASAKVTTDIAYQWVEPSGAGAVNIRPVDQVVDGTTVAGQAQAAVPAGSIPQATSLTAPSPDGAANPSATDRPEHTYSYDSTGAQTSVHVAGLATTTEESVSYDPTGRTLSSTAYSAPGASGLTTTQTWDPGGQDLPTSTTDAAGRETTTIYDWALRATDSYGPAPKSCFASTGFPNQPETGVCTNIAHTHTGYDTDTSGVRISGLETTIWANIDQTGVPAARMTAPPDSAAAQADPALSATEKAQLAAPGGSQSYTGEIAVPPGTYTFGATLGDPANDGIRVFVDDQPVAQRWSTETQAVMDSGVANQPAGFWRLADLAGSATAANQVPGGGAGTPVGSVGFGASGIHASDPTNVTSDPATSASFNGGADVALPGGLISATDTPSVGLWFETTASGVLFGYQSAASGDPSQGWVPALYVDSSGYLRAEFWPAPQIVSPEKVNDGHWHYVMLSGAGSSQSLYLDGALVGTTSGQLSTAGMPYEQIGTGYTDLWPAAPAGWDPFVGQIADVALYQRATTSVEAADDYSAGAPVPPTSQVPLPQVTFAPAPTVALGSLPAAPASTPHRVRIDYRNPVSTAGLTVTATNTTTGQTITIPAGDFDPRYGLATWNVTDDAGGVAGGQTTTATSYSASGLDPVYGLPTSSVADPGGLDLVAKTAYEAPGPGGYLRPLATALPSADISTPAQDTTTTAYYASAPSPLPPAPPDGYYTAQPPDDTGPVPWAAQVPVACPNGGEWVDQGGFPMTITGPTPASGPAVAAEAVYGPDGRVLAARDPAAGDAWTCYSYDSRGRITMVAVPSLEGAPARTVTATYSADGLTTAVADPSGTITTVVDLDGRVVSYTDVTGTTTTTSYDQAGRAVTETTTTSGGSTSTVTSSYDDMSRPTATSVDGAVVAAISYDPTTGDVVSVTYPAGSGDGGNGATMTPTLNPDGEQTALAWALPGSQSLTDNVVRSQSARVMSDTQALDGTTLAAWSYTYDPAGRLVAAALAATATRPAVTLGYTYSPSGGCGADPAAGADSARVTATTQIGTNAATTTTDCSDYTSRLTSATGADPVTNIAYNDHGEMTALGNQAWTYDSSGRVTSTTATDGSTTQTLTYTLDAAGRVVTQAGTGAGPGVDTTAITYAYTGGGDSPSFALAGSPGSYTVAQRYMALPGGALYTKDYTTPADSTWALSDIHGDNIATTNPAGTLISSGFLYDPFGQPLDPTTGNVDTTATPATRDRTATTDAWQGAHQRAYQGFNGLDQTLMGARSYLPAQGVFTAPDPVRGGNANPYTYPADPINDSDLTGKMFVKLPGDYSVDAPANPSSYSNPPPATSAPASTWRPSPAASHRSSREAVHPPAATVSAPSFPANIGCTAPVFAGLAAIAPMSPPQLPGFLDSIVHDVVRAVPSVAHKVACVAEQFNPIGAESPGMTMLYGAGAISQGVYVAGSGAEVGIVGLAATVPMGATEVAAGAYLIYQGLDQIKDACL